MANILTEQELADLSEIQRLIDEAYEHYFRLSDGYSKMSEGAIEVHFGNYFDRSGTGWGMEAPERHRAVNIYSYVLGPSRMHHFPSIAEALETVKKWHADEMTNDHKEDW